MQEQEKDLLKNLFSKCNGNKCLFYEDVLASFSDKSKAKFLLMELQKKRYIRYRTFNSLNKRIILFTKKGLDVLKKKGTNNKRKNRELEQSVFNEDKRNLVDYLLSSGYDIEHTDNKLICKKGFGKYIIHIDPNILKKNISFDDVSKTTKNILFFVTTLEDKIKIQMELQKWIDLKFKGFRNFFQEGYGYSIFFVNDIKDCYDFPRKIPDTTNLYSVYKKCSIIYE